MAITHYLHNVMYILKLWIYCKEYLQKTDKSKTKQECSSESELPRIHLFQFVFNSLQCETHKSGGLGVIMFFILFALIVITITITIITITIVILITIIITTKVVFWQCESSWLPAALSCRPSPRIQLLKMKKWPLSVRCRYALQMSCCMASACCLWY